MSIIEICFAFLLSVIVFHFCYQLGRRSQINKRFKCDITDTDHLAISQRTSVYEDRADTTPDESLCPYDCSNLNYETGTHEMSLNIHETRNGGSVIERAFSDIHHPAAASNAEIIISHEAPIKSLDDCHSYYLTRTGSRTSMAAKCVAVVSVPGGQYQYNSPWLHSHRVGTSANLTDQYQKDYGGKFDFKDEENVLPLMMRNLDKTVDDFRQLMGDPVLPDGTRRAVIIMVANEGVMDLVLNFMCSMKSADIDLSSVVVFVGQPEYISLIQNMGGNAVHSLAFGPIPEKAAGVYGDKVFARLMWLKTTSVYIASKAGFDVIFQDADLVWIKDLIPHLRSQKADIAFMDDGARTTRFTPFFVNSGFYYQKNNPRTKYLMEKMLKTVAEISATHSHQATLIRHITESHHLYGLQIGVMDEEQFPSGIMYHHNKKYLKAVIEKKKVPFVWHMCWTQSREEKVTYFKNIGLWFLPDDDDTCIASDKMLAWVNGNGNDNSDNEGGSGSGSGSGSISGGGNSNGATEAGSRQRKPKRSIKDRCCRVGDYWLNATSSKTAVDIATSKKKQQP